ncbi:MAG TPA: hypothetical protein VEY67_04805, partial [Candidatus Dormibacteraeota bacterium]|nr:hypothetical protein [Candidatus Dormibacteraeota bacterium]
HAPALELLARQAGLPVEILGTVGGDRLVVELAGQGATGAAEERGSRVADALDTAIADLAHAWEHGLARALGQEATELPLSVPATPARPASLVPGEG